MDTSILGATSPVYAPFSLGPTVCAPTCIPVPDNICTASERYGSGGNRTTSGDDISVVDEDDDTL